MTNKKVLVTGAGGFIGHHLVTYLKRPGLLGPRRGHQTARIRHDRTPMSSNFSTCAAGTTACRPRVV